MTPEKAQDLLDYHDKMHGFDITIDEVEELLKQVAGLRYEYAVQHAKTGVWMGEDTDGTVVRTSDPSAADWGMNFEEADSYAAWLSGEELVEYRVVRRLAGEPEVVE